MASLERPLVLHLVHSLEGGGTERGLASLLRAGDHRAMRHAVVTQRRAGSLAAQLPDDVACIALEAKGRSLLAGLRLARLCRRLRPAILHARNVNTWADALMARLRCPSFKLVLGFHGLQAGGRFLRRDRIVARIAATLGAQFTSVSLHGRRQMVEELGLCVEQIHHLPNGIAPGPCENANAPRDAVRSRMGYTSDDFVLGIVGSLTPVKGHEVLLSAMAHAVKSAPTLRLLIVGEGPLRVELEEAVRTHRLEHHVRFLGHRDDVPAILSALDGYVCASRSEGMSNALMEAMGAGLPILTTSVGDHPTVVRDGTDGFIVPPDDAEAMANAIQRLIFSPYVAGEMGRNAWQRIQDFGLDKTVSAYENLYANLLAANPCGIRNRKALSPGVKRCHSHQPSSRSLADTVK